MATKPTKRATKPVAKESLAGTRLVAEKAADFRHIFADSSIPIGSPDAVTIILTRMEPGVLTHVLSGAVTEGIAGILDASVATSEVAPVYVQAAHVRIGHEKAGELAGNMLRLLQALNPDLYRRALERHGFADIAQANAS